MFSLVVLCIVLGSALLPFYIRSLGRGVGLSLETGPAWLPAVAGLCFGVAFFLPDIHISSQTTTFQQHFVGGGIYTVLLAAYFRPSLNSRIPWYYELVLLFAWTSTFGVASELAESTLNHLHLLNIDTTDTDWDLLANTSGSLLGYVVLRLGSVIRHRHG